MLHIRALVVVAILLAVLSIPFLKYWSFLTKGMSPPPSTQILDKMEASGVPNFALEDLQGQVHKLSDYAGQIVILNFWASWCAPCVQEFPSLEQLVQKMNGKVTILAVSNDYTRADLDSFLKAFGELPKQFVVLWDKDKKVSDSYGTDVLPETYIIGRDGRLIRKVAGMTKWDSPMAMRFFSEVVDAK